MEKNFWQQLKQRKQPFFVLAPMAGVTDTVFRQMIVRRAKPDVFWTEFVSCDGLCSRGRDNLLREFSFSENERPIMAQVFGAIPKNFYETARLVVSLGFDGIDINMGCPDKAIVKQGSGAGLIRTPELAREVIDATREGIASTEKSIPLSVKTRTGFDVDEIDTWIPTLLDSNIDAITIHARTKKELSDVPARWEDVARVVKLARGTNTVIIGNGDVKNREDAREKATLSGADGVMIGRAIFGNPWLFRVDNFLPTTREKLEAFVEHAKLYEAIWKDAKSFDFMKKHCKSYVNGFSGASRFRAQLMECSCSSEIKERVNQFLKTCV